MRLSKSVCMLVFAGVALFRPACAQSTSGPVVITELRPYGGTNIVFVYTTLTNGQFCDIAWYSIDLGNNGGKAMYAAALAAVAAGKTVKLEISACGTGPNGSTAIQSLYLQK